MDDSQSESTDFPHKISEEHQIVKKIRIQNENIENNLLENRNQNQNQYLLKEKEDSQTILSQSIIIPVSNEGLSNLDNKNRRKTKIYSINGNIDFQTEYKNDPASYISIR